MKRTRVLAALLLISAAALSAAPAPQETVVLLPFANLAGAERAPASVELALATRLSKLGYRVVRGEEVQAFLAAERVRYVDSLAGPVRERLLAKFSARGAVLGAILAFDEGINPVVGVSLRLLDGAGKTEWSAAVGLTGDDTEGALGLKRVLAVDVLLEKAMDRLVDDFPAPGRVAKVASARGVPLSVPAPRTYRSAELEPGQRHRLCLLPLSNATRDRVASRLIGELLFRRLAASNLFEPVEPSDFRHAMVSAKLAGLKNGDPAELAKLGKALGTSLFLTGTVYKYRDTSAKNPGLSPELELQLTLTDVATGRIVWASSAARKGTDYIGLFQLGAITNMTRLADQVAGEMVRAAEKARGKSPKNQPPAAKSAAAPPAATATVPAS